MNFNFKEKLQSAAVKKVLIVLAGLVSVLAIFQLGQWTGFRRADFANRWGEHYFHGFGESGRGQKMLPGGRQRADFPNQYGEVGQIVKINLPSIVLAGAGNIEREVLVDNNTLVRRFRENITSTELKVGEQIMVIGDPNNAGQIIARLIRYLPPIAPGNSTTTLLAPPIKK